jgi:acetyltransferase-like isoleucine patch superfamily enzyme
MSLTQRFQEFFHQPFYGKVQRLATALTRLKAILFYRWVFGSMGKGCVIGRPLLLSNPHHIYLGHRVLIRPGARLQTISAFPHRTPQLRIGNDVNIEQNVHIICQSRISIGDNVTITGHCAIVDTTHPFRSLSAGQKIGALILDEDSYVIIRDGAFIGFGSVILPNVTIGKSAVIGALSVVDKDVPDFGIACGNPARLLSTYKDPPE